MVIIRSLIVEIKSPFSVRMGPVDGAVYSHRISFENVALINEAALLRSVAKYHYIMPSRFSKALGHSEEVMLLL